MTSCQTTDRSFPYNVGRFGIFSTKARYIFEDQSSVLNDMRGSPTVIKDEVVYPTIERTFQRSRLLEYLLEIEGMVFG